MRLQGGAPAYTDPAPCLDGSGGEPPVRQDTPYSERPSSEQDCELDCMRQVLGDAAVPHIVYDALGGTGMVANLMHELWPGSVIYSWELDGRCVRRYRARRLPRAFVFQGDTLDAGVPGFDAAVLDFNLFTLLDLTRGNRGQFQKALLEKVFQRHPKWVELTDSAVPRLHLNYRSYGLAEPDWERYCDLLSYRLDADWGYRIVSRSHHHAASYYRLEPL